MTPSKHSVPTIVHLHRVKPRERTRHTKTKGTVYLRDPDEPDVVRSLMNARMRMGKANQVNMSKTLWQMST
ncbi:hypothetical protein PsorP6_016637 [Peronosclerospora sorghi]|uniref:Uncharacterized protein n=1 Tax=Peronosclerospora sorghi TaxID=230839 RepID=A0ACC0VPB6_9STRA|nr:hypothetical protein PsorP6_016637 [Peronosclerospora sorghi]